MKHRISRRAFLRGCTLLAASAAVGSLTSCGGTDAKDSGLPLIIVGSDTYPPYIYLNNDGVPAGIDVEIATEAFRRMGYAARFESIDWEQKTNLVESGTIDCIWGCFSMDGREEIYRRAVAAVSGQVPETLHNIRTIRALGLEDYMERRYDRCIGAGYAAMERTNFYDALYSPVVLVLNAVVVGIVMLLSASGNPTVLTFFGMSVGTSVAVINYISRIFAPIESLGMEIQTIQSAMAGVERIDAFLGQPERTAPAAQPSAARGDVELSHVTFGYGEKEVLHDLSMTVKQGEQITLIGRTGAGKSTVFKLLLGLYPPQEGTVTIGGVPVAAITDRERRTCIGCVEQHFARVPGTVLEQITLGDPQITEEMAKRAAVLAGIDGAIQTLPQGYGTPCTDSMFSQGEWQLLSIARAVAADPAVLLLDEITANLDAETEARVLEALRRASAGRTVLSVSHRIYEDLGGRTVEIKTRTE